MSSFKKLSKADVTSVPYAANKRWSFVYSSSLLNKTGSEITVYQAQKGTFNITGSTTTNGQYQSLIYAQINHLFYQSYSGSLLNTGSLKFNTETYVSASQQRPTSSYFDYNANPLLVKNYTTSSTDQFSIINVSQKIYGSKILPNSLVISSSTTYITDDGNGNLYDIAGITDEYIALSYISSSYFLSGSIDSSGITHVGNVFYAHGLIVLTATESKYDGLFTTAITNSISFQNEHIIHENEVRCIVKESEYNLSYNPTLVNGNYASGSLRGFATSASFAPYATTIGLYNDDNELLMVAKLGKPMMISPDTDMCFVVKYDT
jgi:hypothetical protein